MTDILTFFNILHKRQIQHNTCKMSKNSASSPNTKGLSVQSRQQITVQSLRYKILSLNQQIEELQEENSQNQRDIDHLRNTQEKCNDLDIKMEQQSLQQTKCLQQMQQHQDIFMEQRAQQYYKFLEDCSKQYNRYIDDIVHSQDKFIAKGKRYQFKKIKRLKRLLGQNRRDLRLDQQKIQNLEDRIRVLLRN